MEEKAFVHRKVAIIGMVCVGVAGMLAGFLAGYGVNGESTSTHSNTSVETNIDTGKVRKPVAKGSTVISYIKVPIAALKGDTQNGRQNAAPMEPPTQHNADDALKGAAQNHTNYIGDARDTAIYLPRTQKRYEDSTYTAWVSGYEPRLDSIEVYRKTTTITKTITRTVTKRHVFNVGIVGGAGYGLLTKKPDVWVGVGVSINLFRR